MDIGMTIDSSAREESSGKFSFRRKVFAAHWNFKKISQRDDSSTMYVNLCANCIRSVMYSVFASRVTLDYTRSISRSRFAILCRRRGERSAREMRQSGKTPLFEITDILLKIRSAASITSNAFDSILSKRVLRLYNLHYISIAAGVIITTYGSK